MIEAPRVASFTVSASGTSAQSAALSGEDIVIECATAFHILFGSNPTATTSCMRIPADTVVRFTNINPGEKFAVILASGSDTVRYSVAV